MDHYHLQRFITAQEQYYSQALQEIRAGRKQSHWIWFIFPQLAGLGHSEKSKFYGIQGRGEAQAYLDHPVLGPRLIEITSALQQHPDKPIKSILGSVDAIKCQSCMELFSSLPGADPVFKKVLKSFYY